MGILERTIYHGNKLLKFKNKLLGGKMIDLSNENIVHKTKNGIQFLQFRKLLEYPELIHCYTLKTDDFDIAGNDTYEDKKEIVKKNYIKLAEALEIKKETMIRPYQTHTNVVKRIDDKPTNITIFPKELTNVDGLITDKNNITFSLSFADCTPIYLYDPIKRVIRKYSFWLERNLRKNWKNCGRSNDYRI